MQTASEGASLQTFERLNSVNTSGQKRCREKIPRARKVRVHRQRQASTRPERPLLQQPARLVHVQTRLLHVLQMQKTLLWRDEGLLSRAGRKGGIQARRACLRYLCSNCSWRWECDVQNARNRIYRVQMQVLLLHCLMVLLGQYSLLRAVSQAAVCR